MNDLQQAYEQEKKEYETRNENARKQVINQADNDRTEHVQK